MKEIKFRLRNCVDKIVGYEKWYKGSLDSKNFYTANPCWLYSTDGKYWNPKTIQHRHKDQYTGLKDKKGKDIYEKDIIEFIGERLETSRKQSKRDGEYKFRGVINDTIPIREGSGILDDSNSYNDKILKKKGQEWFDRDKHVQRCYLVNGINDILNGKVIGNIYENSELLK